ncbi:uncharacterized protein Z520_04862 [Fonsecaea multimorphosa CBS 102226]|uniref:Uncharacterized protein n=1 Tax=Fonsecaea multimorphosa CBS 102226 TaxID=1442371 RepID=A0A0D2IQN0_9EURO|nr:uncharacterized protein Z520_04862 [Fonsecaea multimorphosa CBS 102226]KIX99286.1 hypothetical protein Z520_04862 [Fonsecaea multimorphosa CBS 102226]OAL25976.1 hypothetical protein AYO22_04603 [Fonsecaea multimorphosa]
MAVCPSLSDANQAKPVVGDLSYHTLTTYVSAGTTICTWILCSILTLAHLVRYAEPRQQRQILRLIWTPAVFAIFSFFGVWHYNLANYLTPIAELYECFALIALFFLLIAYLAPESFEGQRQFFATHAGTVKSSDTSNVDWFRKIWITVIQILPTRVITVIATEIVEATQCQGTKRYRRANTIISIVQGVLTAICVIGISKFYLRFRSELHAADRRIFFKMGAFKLVVFVQLLQRIILNALSQSDALNPTESLSYNDLNLGLNSFLTCMETFIFAVLFVWPFWPQRTSTNSKAGVISAALDAVNLGDIFAGIVRAGRLYRGKSSVTTASHQSWYAGDNRSGHAQQQEFVGNKLESDDGS